MFDKSKRQAAGISSQQRTALKMGERLFKILRLVQQRRPGQPLGREELAQACECSVKTITRATDLLESEYGVVYEAAKRAYVLPREEPLIPTAPLSFDEIVALAAAGTILRSPQFPHQGKAASALDKIVGGLTPIRRAVAEAALRSLPPATLPRDYGRVLLQPFVDAIQNHATLRLDYDSRSSGSRAWRDVDPYAIEARDGLYYELHGWCHKNHGIRTFALDRAHDAQTTGQTFVRDEAAWGEFEKGRGVGGMRGGSGTPLSVDVRFAPLVAAYASDQHWPASLHLHPTDDGTGWVQLRGHIADGSPRDALLSELLRWRRHVTILGGPELRQAYRFEIQAMLSQHCSENI